MQSGYGPQPQLAQQYKRQQIETASPEELLILLYEGAIKFLLVAKKAYQDKKDIEKFHNNLIKAQAIIIEFMSSLDMELGGEMAKNLFALYEYLHYRLVQANLKKDLDMVDEVIDHLRKLKATWEEAIEIARKEKALEAPFIARASQTTDHTESADSVTISSGGYEA